MSSGVWSGFTKRLSGTELVILGLQGCDHANEHKIGLQVVFTGVAATQVS